MTEVKIGPEPEDIECNGHIIRDIAADMSLNIGTVEDIIKSVTSYVAEIVRCGALEGVMVPFLGKFHIKPYTIQYKNFLYSIGKEMRVYLKQNPNAAATLAYKPEDDEQTT